MPKLRIPRWLYRLFNESSSYTRAALRVGTLLRTVGIHGIRDRNPIMRWTRCFNISAQVFQVIVKRGKSWWTYKIEGHRPEVSERIRLWYRIYDFSITAALISLCTTASECHNLPSMLFATHIIQKNRSLPPLSRPQRNGSPFLMLCRRM